MIENFNGIFYLAIFLVILAMNTFYGYSCLFNTKNFMNKYGIDITSAFFCRFAGLMIAGSVLMQLYILFRGTEVHLYTKPLEKKHQLTLQPLLLPPEPLLTLAEMHAV